jgi:hypothetical protein
MLRFALELHQVHHIDHSYFQVRQIFTQYGYGREGFQRRRVTAAGHYHIRFLALVVACPLPNADALCAMPDRGIHIQPLRPRMLGGDHHVDIIFAAQAMVDTDSRQFASAEGKGAQIGLFISDMIQKAGS